MDSKKRTLGIKINQRCANYLCCVLFSLQAVLMLYYVHGTDQNALRILTHLILTQACKEVTIIFLF